MLLSNNSNNQVILIFSPPDNIPIIWSHVQQSGTSQIAIGKQHLCLFCHICHLCNIYHLCHCLCHHHFLWLMLGCEHVIGRHSVVVKAESCFKKLPTVTRSTAECWILILFWEVLTRSKADSEFEEEKSTFASLLHWKLHWMMKAYPRICWILELQKCREMPEIAEFSGFSTAAACWCPFPGDKLQKSSEFSSFKVGDGNISALG